jgi:hypothetical protein
MAEELMVRVGMLRLLLASLRLLLFKVLEDLFLEGGLRTWYDRVLKLETFLMLLLLTIA